MTTAPWEDQATQAIVRRATERFNAHRDQILRSTDRLFAWLMIGQWIFGIVIALTYSPYGWEGKVKSVHVHVLTAVVLGFVLSSLPVALALLRPGWVVTRHVMAVAQMLWSALLIHLTGGRIETHFHVFGSLTFLAFYRDWRVLLTGTIVVAADHLLRGYFWPQSAYGVLTGAEWRWLEHAGWVLFLDFFLVLFPWKRKVERSQNELPHFDPTPSRRRDLRF